MGRGRRGAGNNLRGALTTNAAIGNSVIARASFHLSKGVRKSMDYDNGVIVNPGKGIAKGVISAGTRVLKRIRNSVRIDTGLILGTATIVGNSVFTRALRVRPGTHFGKIYGVSKRGWQRGPFSWWDREAKKTFSPSVL